MKLVTYIDGNGAPALGALINNDKDIASLQAGANAQNGENNPFFSSMLCYIHGGKTAFDQATETLDYITSQTPPDTIFTLNETQLLAPLPRPESVRDCMAFEDHVINCARSVGLGKLAGFDRAIEKTLGRKYTLAYKAMKPWYERPVYYKSNRFSVIGTGADVVMPSYATIFDYELEWGIVIGKQGTDITKENAKDHIAGYTIFNDFSVRNIQMKEMRGRLGPAKGKDFNTGNAIGPCLVTPDELPDPYNLEMKAEINGEEWSRGNSGEMHWSFEDIIAYISQSETLHPGEFIGSGTCSGKQGMGCGLEHGKFLKSGDIVELSVEKIGVLMNKVTSEGSAD